jgi:class 3 adenylate cyclase
MADLADEGRRLALASALMRHAAERAGQLPPEADVAALLVAGRSLARGVDDFEERHHVRFDPAYPGVVAGPEATGKRARVLFACTASRPDGRAVGAVLTTLIAGRRPTVSVGPPGTLVH